MRIIDEALIGLIGAGDEGDVYRAVVEAVHALEPDTYLAASSLSPDGTYFEVNATAGLEGVLGPMRKLLGGDPLARTFPLREMRPEDDAAYRTGRVETVEGGLYSVLLGGFPKAACAAVERLLGIRTIQAVGFCWNDMNYGGLLIAPKRGATLTKSAAIEMLVHQATIAIRRFRAETELREQERRAQRLLHREHRPARYRQPGRLLPPAEPALGEGARLLHRRADEPPLPRLRPPRGQGRHRGRDGRTGERTAAVAVREPLPHTDGSYRWLEWRAFPRGNLIYAAARDLTERIESEQAIKDSEARYRLMAENTADVIWILDLATMRFTYVSPSVQQLRGYTVREVQEQSIDEVLTPESAERVAAMLPPEIAALEAGDETARINVTEVDQPRKDGSVVATEVTTTLLTNADGRVDRVLGVSRDISERRQAEAKIRALNESLEARVHERTAQLESAIAELEAFSYSVSHDLRAPLRAINGYATILAEDHAGDIGADGMRCCDNIIGNTRRMGQLIDDLLSFSRLGRSRLAWEPIDMAALAHSAYGEVATEGQRGQVSFTVGRLAPATGDPTLLRQVWANLLSNALKFTSDADGPSIVVGGRQADGEAVYTVSDNGRGFDMDHAGKLFEVFEHLHGGEFEGSGIGLAIVRRAVEAHGGRVWAESAPGEGATFSFALPTGRPEQEPAS